MELVWKKLWLQSQTTLTNEPGLRREVPDRNRDLLSDVLADDFNVVLELGRDGDDWSTFCYCA